MHRVPEGLGATGARDSGNMRLFLSSCLCFPLNFGFIHLLLFLSVKLPAVTSLETGIVTLRWAGLWWRDMEKSQERQRSFPKEGKCCFKKRGKCCKGRKINKWSSPVSARSQVSYT